jgi:shikimate dehydrogenase
MAELGDKHVVGLIGAGIGASLSPQLHEREADRLGLRYIYQLIDISGLGIRASEVATLVGDARRMGFRGLNVTHPCKQTIVSQLDELSQEAAFLGAVNTVVFEGGLAIGYNTDWFGFAQGFVRGLPDAALGDVVLLGAGGAGAAVAHAVLSLGARRLTIVDIQSDRAARLAAQFAGHYSGATVVAGTPQNVAIADGLINATPIGMAAHPGMPIAPNLLRPGMWVADIVYVPLETELLRLARERGCRTLNGGGMVVFQAAEAFRLFTGRVPDPDRMWRHFEELTKS